MSLNRNIRFIGHEIYRIDSPNFPHLEHIDNIIYKTGIPEIKWIEESTTRIGEWRDIIRSTYIRWAISINGLFVASEKYKDPAWKKTNKFHVTGYRLGRSSVAPTKANLVEWDGDTAAKAHLESVNMIASYGLIDLYSCMEEMIFDFHRIFYKHNPDPFIIGPDNKSLRKLYNNRTADPNSYNEALTVRLDAWQRRRIYDGLDKVLVAYMSTAKLETPKSYTHTTPETWAESVKGIAILRNCLTHGEKKVPKELADISNKPHGLGFQMKEGDLIELSTFHLMSVELFLDQLLSAINLSLGEKGEKEFLSRRSNPI